MGGNGCQIPTRHVPGWCWLNSMGLRESAPDETASASDSLSNTSHTIGVWSTLRQPKDGFPEPPGPR